MRNETQYITTTEAADILKFTSSRIRQLARAGKLEAVKFGRDWLISRADVEALRQAQDAKYRRKREGK